MNKAQSLLEALEDLTWENYVDIADGITAYDKHAIDDEMTDKLLFTPIIKGFSLLRRKHLMTPILI